MNTKPLQRRLLASWVLPLLVFLTLPAVVQAQFTFTTNNGAITITGYTGSGGAVTIPGTTNGYPVTSVGDYAFYDSPALTSVTIPSNVTNIGNFAFLFCRRLTNITMPNSLISIGDGAFYSCTSLINITIPNSVTSIGGLAFFSCSGLTSITLPSTIANIGDMAFAECTGLTNTAMPNGLTRIGEGVFENCSSLTSVIVPDSVVSIGSGAFFDSANLSDVTLGNSVTNLGDYAFSGCFSLTGVYCRGNAPIVGSSVFSGDTNAIGYFLPDAMNWTSTFGGCPTVLWNPPVPYTYTTNNGTITITGYTGPGGAVTIPRTINFLPVTIIEDDAFAYCGSLTTITLPNSVTSIGDSAFYSSSLTSITIPNSVSSISDWAFAYCPGLSNVSIPNSVTNIGAGVFAACTSLNAISVDALNPAFITVNGVLFDKGQTTLVSYPGGKAGGYIIPDSVTSIAEAAFCSCTGLTSITIPNGVTSIGDYAFDSCTGLNNATIGSNVTSIGDYAFAWCSSLGRVNFGGNAPNLGEFVFDGDDNATVYYLSGTVGWASTFGGLAAVHWDPLEPYGYTTNNGSITITDYVGPGGALTIPSTIASLPVTSIGDDAFAYCGSLTTITLPDSVTSIGNSAFYSSSLTSTTIPNSVSSISDWAFAYCPNLTNVSIPNSVTNIGTGTFAACPNLNGITVDALNPAYTAVNGVLFDKGRATLVSYPGAKSGGYIIPDGVTSIAEAAFCSCTNLSSITIPNGVTSIGDYAFDSCAGLNNATIGSNVTNIGDYAFAWCPLLTNLTIPNKVMIIGDYAFDGCTGLTSISLGNGVANIGAGAFNGCYNLPRLTVPNSVTIIGDYAFGGCTSLTNVTLGNSVTTIGTGAFDNCYDLASITFPAGITSIGELAFAGCSDLAKVYFQGNAPQFVGKDAFTNDSNATAYYLPGTTGWGWAFAAIPSVLQFIYTNVNGNIIITGYTGPGGAVTIPGIINGWQVTAVGDYAFDNCQSLISVTIPDSVTNMGDYAFSGCSSLAGVWFRGNAPTLGSFAFSGDDNATVYYLPEKTGWGAAFGGLPTVPSEPLMPFTYTTNNGTISITGYIGSNGVAVIPSTINGLAVTSIGDNAFNYCDALTEITIPDSITTLGASAFACCTNLTSVMIGDGVTSIGVGDFGGCSKLTKVIMGQSVSSTGNYTFLGCPSLSVLYFRGNAPFCFWQSFSPCSPTVFYLPGTSGWLTTGWGPTGSDFPTLLWNLPPISCNYATNNGTIIITRYTGSGGAVTIPDTINSLPVTCVGGGAFCGCSNLTSVAISSGVTSIGDYAFSNCASLTTVTIADSVTSIGSAAFGNCPGLTGLYFGGNPPSIGAGTFSSDGHATVIYLLGSSGWGSTFGGLPVQLLPFNYTINHGRVTITGLLGYTGPGCAATIPNTINLMPVTAIGDGTFCQYLYYSPNPVTVTIPANVTSVGPGAFDVGYAYDSALTNIMVDASNPVYSSLDGVLFNKGKTTLIYCPRGRGVGAYTIPNSVTSVGDRAFGNCFKLDSVTIPDSVCTVGSAFYGCSSLTDVNFRGNAPILGAYAFSGDNNATVYYLPGSTGWGSTFGGRPALLQEPPAGYNYLTADDAVTVTDYAGSGGAVTIPSTINFLPVTSIAVGAFDHCTNLVSITIPSSVASVGDMAFANCANLTSAVIPNSLTSIGEGVFSNCTSLTSATIPDSVTSIAKAAFYNCVSLNSITIGNTVTSIGDYAFCGCFKLTAANFRGNAPLIGLSVFSDDGNAMAYYLSGTTGWGPVFGGLPTVLWNPPLPYTYTTEDGSITITKYTGSGGAVTIPSTIDFLPVCTIGYPAFLWSGLTSVRIPGSVTTIQNCSFLCCGGLKEVYFQGDAPTLGGTSIFGYDNNATVYYLPGTTGWSSTFGGIPALLWNPEVQTSDPSFGVLTNGFGFTITGTTNIPLVIEACADLANPIWTPLQSCTLTNGSIYFSDPQWTNYPGRFYRLRTP